MRVRTLFLVATVGAPALWLGMGVGSLQARPTRITPTQVAPSGPPSAERTVCIERCDQTARRCLERCPMSGARDCNRACITAEFQCQGQCPGGLDGGVAMPVPVPHPGG